MEKNIRKNAGASTLHQNLPRSAHGFLAHYCICIVHTHANDLLTRTCRTFTTRRSDKSECVWRPGQHKRGHSSRRLDKQTLEAKTIALKSPEKASARCKDSREKASSCSTLPQKTCRLTAVQGFAQVPGNTSQADHDREVGNKVITKISNDALSARVSAWSGS